MNTNKQQNKADKHHKRAKTALSRAKQQNKEARQHQRNARSAHARGDHSGTHQSELHQATAAKLAARRAEHAAHAALHEDWEAAQHHNSHDWGEIKRETQAHEQIEEAQRTQQAADAQTEKARAAAQAK